VMRLLNKWKMKTLIIVRHGAFSHDKPGVLDAAHSLNHRGRHDVAAAAERFAALQITPDLVLTSPARRARETTEIFQKKMKLPEDRLQPEAEIYEAEKREVLRIVHRQDDSNDIIMIVGHNPGMTSLLHHLVDGEVEKMPSSSFAVVELDVNSWRQVSFKKATLKHFSAPEVKEPHHSWWWRFTFWRRQRMQKVELFVVFLIGLLLILGIIALIVSSSTDSAGMPQQGSMGRNYNTE